jgi:16S rRNA (cytosine1402-N4)-methyltransferase
MNQRSTMTAQKILNSYQVKELQRVFSEYGEVRNARTLAKKIGEERERSPIVTSEDLNQILLKYRIGDYQKYQSQVYQALRIEVNDEMGALEDALKGVVEVLKPGGRLVVLTYHSIEDRVVKKFIKTGNLEGKLEKDDFGRIIRPLSIINKKPILASAKELARNSRSRSAKLRIAEKGK